MLMDGSAEMLRRASDRLDALSGRHAQLQAEIADPGWRTGEHFGGVMTSLAVHHLDSPAKQALYADLLAMLVPGGTFVMADLVEPAGPAARRLDWLRAAGCTEVDAAWMYAGHAIFTARRPAG
jgi:tRNA (cmo5U34)-methyltransferase